MTTAEAARRLHVSQRQVERLIRRGDVPARRTAGDAWVVDALAVNALGRSRPTRGRPWSAEVAWGALWVLSDLEAPWLDPRTRVRVSSRLASMDALGLVHACRRRADVVRYRVSESFLDELRGALVVSGASAAERYSLAEEAARVEGYCDAETSAKLRAEFRLVDDTDPVRVDLLGAAQEVVDRQCNLHAGSPLPGDAVLSAGRSPATTAARYAERPGSSNCSGSARSSPACSTRRPGSSASSR